MNIEDVDIIIAAQVLRLSVDEVKRVMLRYVEIQASLPQMEKEIAQKTKELEAITQPLSVAKAKLAEVTAEHNTLRGHVEQKRLEEQKLTQLLAYFTQELVSLRSQTSKAKEKLDSIYEEYKKKHLILDEKLSTREDELNKRQRDVTLWVEEQEKEVAAKTKETEQKMKELKDKEVRIEKMLHEQLRLKAENAKKEESLKHMEETLCSFTQSKKK